MVRYFCRNCDNLLLKQIGSLIEHVWGKHGIEAKKYPNRSIFMCKECNLPFGSISLFLNHIDKAHGIHIWYEKGLTKRRIFFDGTLSENLTGETKRRYYVPKSHFTPISYEILRDQEEDKPQVADEKRGYCLRCKKLRNLVDYRVCRECYRLGF
jgi:hypothetical protein